MEVFSFPLLQLVDFLLGIFLDPEDGADIFSETSGLCPKYTELQPATPHGS
jgi:hypothetical protein